MMYKLYCCLMRYELVIRLYTAFLRWRALIKSEGKILARSLFWRDLNGEDVDIYKWIKINKGRPYDR